jgi:hypothetical protein
MKLEAVRAGTRDRHDGRWLFDRAGSGSPAFPNDTPESCAPECIVFLFRSLRRRSRFNCCGIHGWMPIQRIAGCAAAFGKFARSNSPNHRHAEELPKVEVISRGPSRPVLRHAVMSEDSVAFGGSGHPADSAIRHGAEDKLDFRASHILPAFANSVSPHSYKGRMKSDWVWIARPLRSRHFCP